MSNQLNIQIYSKSYSECTQKEIDDFLELLVLSDADDYTKDYNLLKDTFRLFFAYVDSTLVGISAIKTTDYWYIKLLSLLTNVENLDDYQYEFGYLYVIPEYRRKTIAFNLVRERLKLVNKAFATVRVDNTSSVKTLQNNGFVALGDTYPSSRGDYYLQVMVI